MIADDDNHTVVGRITERLFFNFSGPRRVNDHYLSTFLVLAIFACRQGDAVISDDKLSTCHQPKRVGLNIRKIVWNDSIYCLVIIWPSLG